MLPDHRSLLRLLPRQHIRTATRLGLAISPDLDRESWSKLFANVVHLAGRMSRGKDTVTAWLGDLLAQGQSAYYGQIAEYAELAGLDPGTLRNAKLVCSRIEVSWRHDTLTWAHLCEVGFAFDVPNDIRYWLDRAVKENLSSRELRRKIRQHLAKPPPDKTPGGAVAVAPFTFLRELRAVGRFVQKHPDVWTEWPPDTCRLALHELAPVVEFLDTIRTRAGENDTLRLTG